MGTTGSRTSLLICKTGTNIVPLAVRARRTHRFPHGWIRRDPAEIVGQRCCSLNPRGTVAYSSCTSARTSSGALTFAEENRQMPNVIAMKSTGRARPEAGIAGRLEMVRVFIAIHDEIHNRDDARDGERVLRFGG